MTDLRLTKIEEECDAGILAISEALKDMRAGLLPPAEVKKLIERHKARVPVLERRLDDIKKELAGE